MAPLAATAAERLPWDAPSWAGANDAYRPPSEDGYGSGGATPGPDGAYRPRGNDAYRPPVEDSYRPADTYRPADRSRGGDTYQPRPGDRYEEGRDDGGYGESYRRPQGPDDRAGYDERYEPVPPPRDRGYAEEQRGYSKNEIMNTGHKFFGSISQGLASVVEYAFKSYGRPNGYILGEDAGGAVVAGLRYGEGTLYTRDAGTHRVYWQGPSLGYDLGAEGSKTMVLVYNLRDPSDIFHRFGGVQGSAYLVGGVSIQFQKHDDVVLAPIRSGVGLRLGANVGYLKYTRKPTWNPF